MAPKEGSRTEATFMSVKANYEEKNTLLNKDLEDRYFNGSLVFKTKIVWPNAIFFLFVHSVALLGVHLVLTHPVGWKYFLTEYILSLVYNSGITVGAHRLWTHRCYKARRPLRIILMICQTVTGQNCLHTWIKDHRQHHKYSDTDADPHNASRGIFFSHIGWLMMKKHPLCYATRKSIYMADVEADPVVMFQKKYYKLLFLIFNVVGTNLVDAWACGWPPLHHLFYLYMLRYALALNITWTVNSLAHFYGNKPYDKSILPAENKLVSVMTNGEGWHNYHHAFPWDYKAAEYGRDFNNSARLIRFFERIGWAYDLKEATYDIVMKTIYKKGDGSHELAEDVVSQKNSEIKHPTPNIDQLSMGW